MSERMDAGNIQHDALPDEALDEKVGMRICAIPGVLRFGLGFDPRATRSGPRTGSLPPPQD